MNRFRKFFRLTWREKLIFCESLSFHLLIGLLLKVLPFRLIPGLFKNPQSASGSQKSEVIVSIRSAVQSAGRVSPWLNRCLVSSLAGRCMLRRRKIISQLSLGVAKNDVGKTIAHAWLRAGDVEVVTAGEGFSELYQF